MLAAVECTIMPLQSNIVLLVGIMWWCTLVYRTFAQAQHKQSC